MGADLEGAPLIKLEIWDFDSVSADEFLGEISFPLPYGDGDNFIDMEVQANRSKSPNMVKGRVQARVYFKNQYIADDSEAALDPYEKAFCEYFGTRVVDEQFARTIAPPLIFFHLGWRRILSSQLRDAWRHATNGLLASKAARGPKTRAQCYLELVSSFCFAVGVASVWLFFDPLGDDTQIGAIIGGGLAGIFVPDPGMVLANLLWHRPAPTLRLGLKGLGGEGWGVPVGLAGFALFVSLLGMAAFLAMAEQKAVDKLWLAIATLAIVRLAALPILGSSRNTKILLVAKRTGMWDWFLRLYPSIMSGHGAMVQRLPEKMLTPPA